MAHRMMSRAVSSLIVLALLAAAPSARQDAQPPTNPAMAEVRQTLEAARKEMDEYRAGGGRAGAPDHPAVKWQAALWEHRQRYPGTDAAALATAGAIQFLIRAELWEQAHARIDSLSADDFSWERLAAHLYLEGSLRKDSTYAIAKLSEVAAGSASASIKSAALLVLGRIQRRQGDSAAAVRTLESARDTAPQSASAQEAEGILYEIAHLSVGLVAPRFSGRTRTGRAIDLEALRGSAVVMVFWGTT